VTAKILETSEAKKVIIFKKRSAKVTKKKQGHRRNFGDQERVHRA